VRARRTPFNRRLPLNTAGLEYSGVNTAGHSGCAWDRNGLVQLLNAFGGLLLQRIGHFFPENFLED